MSDTTIITFCAECISNRVSVDSLASLKIMYDVEESEGKCLDCGSMDILSVRVYEKDVKEPEDD